MLVIPRYQRDGLWIGPVFVRIMRIRVNAETNRRLVELGVEASASVPITRAEHLTAKSDEELRSLGYIRTASGIILPCQPAVRAA